MLVESPLKPGPGDDTLGCLELAHGRQPWRRWQQRHPGEVPSDGRQEHIDRSRIRTLANGARPEHFFGLGPSVEVQ